MHDRLRDPSSFWLPETDGRGNRIDSDVMDSAQRNWYRVLDYASREAVDPSRAAQVLERTAVSVASARRRKQGHTDINDLDSYLFAAFVRKLKRLLRRERIVEFVHSVSELESVKSAQDREWAGRLEDSLQIQEIIAAMDDRTRNTYWKRAHGYGWREIARAQGLSVNAAKKNYEYGLEKVRRRISGETSSSDN